MASDSNSLAILTIFNLLSLGIFFYLIFYATKSFKLNVTIREIKFLTSFEFIRAYIWFISSQEWKRNKIYWLQVDVIILLFWFSILLCYPIYYLLICQYNTWYTGYMRLEMPRIKANFFPDLLESLSSFEISQKLTTIKTGKNAVKIGYF